MQEIEKLDVESQRLSDSWYEQGLYDLTDYGMPWLPLIGTSSFKRQTLGRNTGMHVHVDCIEFSYCRAGVCEYATPDRRFLLRSGQIFVSRPDEPHQALSYPKGFSAVHFLFRPVRDSDVSWLKGEFEKLPRLLSGGPHMRSRFGRIFPLLDIPDGAKLPGVRLRLRTEMLSLLLAILDSTVYAIRPGVERCIREITAEMKAHPERRYPVDSLIARSGMSPTSFINSFKTAVGFTPHAFLLHCRVEQAKRYLEEGMPVKVIADGLGFPSPQHLATTFRKVTGCTPCEWQERM